MTTVRIWVYDGILASGVAGPVDVFSAANQFHARKAAPGMTSAPVFVWRVESLDGRPVEGRAQELLIEQDGIISGGSVTSYLNLAVRLVETFAGEALATMTAKALLIDMNRTSQASFATLLDEHGHTDTLVARAQQQMEATLQQGFRLGDLAASLAVSERTLNRRFKEAVGLAPLTYLQNLRIEVAKRLLETRPIGLEAVSQRVGYGDISTFRQLFKRKTGLSPSEYQMRFSRAVAAENVEVEPGSNGD
jgi:transcriptional regulator GlxA family with amidase domain